MTSRRHRPSNDTEAAATTATTTTTSTITNTVTNTTILGGAVTRSDAPGTGGKTFKRRKFHAKAGKSIDIEVLTHALEEDSGVMEDLKRYAMVGDVAGLWVWYGMGAGGCQKGGAGVSGYIATIKNINSSNIKPPSLCNCRLSNDETRYTSMAT